MTAARSIWLVARREIRERSKGRTYRLTTLILAVVVVAAVVLPTIIGGDDETTYALGIVGSIHRDFVATLEVLADATAA